MIYLDADELYQGFVVAGVVALIVLACFHQETKSGVWRVCFGLGIVVRFHFSLLVAFDISTDDNRFPFRFSSSESAW
jgi:hypothetical protein